MRSSNVVHLTSVVGFLVRSFAHSIVRSFSFRFFSRFDGSLVCFRLCVGIFSSNLDCDCKYECVLLCVSVCLCECVYHMHAIWRICAFIYIYL